MDQNLSRFFDPPIAIEVPDGAAYELRDRTSRKKQISPPIRASIDATKNPLTTFERGVEKCIDNSVAINRAYQ